MTQKGVQIVRIYTPYLPFTQLISNFATDFEILIPGYGENAVLCHLAAVVADADANLPAVPS